MYMGIYGEENPRSSSTSRVASVYRWRWLPKAVESVLALMSCRRSVVQPEGVAGGVLDGEDAGGILGRRWRRWRRHGPHGPHAVPGDGSRSD